VGTMNGQFHQPPTHKPPLPKTHLNVILPSLSRSSKWPLYLSPYQHHPCSPSTLCFHHFRIFGDQYKSCSSTFRHVLNCPLASSHLGSNVLFITCNLLCMKEVQTTNCRVLSYGI
jgi:hypothetical protein